MEELKKKIAEAMSCKFVGDYKFNEEELSEIYSYSERRLREFEYGYINKISTLDYEILFVAMVNSVKTWTSDEDTFWNRIAKKFSGTEICSQKLYHMHGQLNRASKTIKPQIHIPVACLPTRIVNLEFKPNSTNTVELYMDGGWQFSFRIHNAATKVETSLKFDIQIVGMPTTIITINCSWN